MVRLSAIAGGLGTLGLLTFFLVFLQKCAMERNDFRLEGEFQIFLQLVQKVPLLLRQAAYVVVLTFRSYVYCALSREYCLENSSSRFSSASISAYPDAFLLLPASVQRRAESQSYGFAGNSVYSFLRLVRGWMLLVLSRPSGVTGT